MSFNYINQEKSIDDFTLEIKEKTKLFFKTFNELTKDNLDTYLDCINLLDIWNTKEEKDFLWNSFYKYNIKGKVIESSVLKGLNEILSKDDNISSIIDFDEKNDKNSYNDLNIIKISYTKKISSSIIKSSLNSTSDLSLNNLIPKKDINNIKKFIEENNIKILKQIKNIMILLNINCYNNNKHKNPSIKLSEVFHIFTKYPNLKISTNIIITYLSLISENISSNNNDNYKINNDLYKLSITLFDNKIKNLEKESAYNDELDENFNNSISLSNNEDNKNNLENKIKTLVNDILDIEEENKEHIQIFKEMEKSLKDSIQNIINNFKTLLSIRNQEINNELNKITDKDDNEDEIKINIENNIFYIKNRAKELDIFIEETEKNLNRKEIKNKNLNIFINKLIENKLILEEEKNELILRNKEEENRTDIQLNIVDEKINNLTKEKKILQNKINELMEQIDKEKQAYKNNQSIIKELDEMFNLKVKELEQKENEIKILKKENKKFKDDYNSLINQMNEINNNKKNEFKEYEKKLILNAKSNIEKKMKLDETQKKLCYLNHEQLLEYSIIISDKFNSTEKKLEEINQLLKEKNKKINDLESDLELYREKNLELSKENKLLKNNNNENVINQNKKQFTLADLDISRNSVSIEENQNHNNKTSNGLNIIDNETPRNSNANNLFAPPCSYINVEKPLYNIEKPGKVSDNEIINKFGNINHDNKFQEQNNNLINNKKEELIVNKDNDKLYSNEINNGNNNVKMFYNTPKEGNNKKYSNNKEGNFLDVLKEIINEKQSNPYKINDLNNNSIYITNDRVSNPFKNENDNDNDRISNPYRLDNNNNNNRISNSYNDNNDRISNPYRLDNDNNNYNNNLNINKEIENNNELYKDNIITSNGNIKQDYISKSNIIINKNMPIYVDKSLSLKEMNEIFKKNHENKLNIENFDYLHLYNNEKIRDIFLKIGDICPYNEIFSDVVYLLDEYDKIYKHILFITKKCIYIIETSTYKIKYTFVRNLLIRFTIANNNCNIIVFHFNKGNDLVIMTLRRPELILYFLKIRENDKNESEIKFKYADEFNVKKDGRYYTQKIKASMNSIAFNFQTAIKLGYLTKINEGYIFNQYHDKLVVLTDFGLFYFDNPTVSPKKLIPIIGSDIVPLESKFNDILYVFEIKTINKQRIVFGTDDKIEYDEWIKTFNEVKAKYEKK